LATIFARGPNRCSRGGREIKFRRSKRKGSKGKGEREVNKNKGKDVAPVMISDYFNCKRGKGGDYRKMEEPRRIEELQYY